MKLYGSYGEDELLDAVVWRSRKGTAWGGCVPVTWKRILFVIVTGRKVEAQFVWRRRADAIKAALAKAPR